MSLRKALHNEQLCLTLAEQNKWHDWVAITAFYAALHFVDSTLFPLDTGGPRRFDSIIEYSIHRGEKRSRHRLRMELVEKRLWPVHHSFKYLLDLSSDMRYGGSLGDESIASSAVKHLRHLKKHCV